MKKLLKFLPLALLLFISIHFTPIANAGTTNGGTCNIDGRAANTQLIITPDGGNFKGELKITSASNENIFGRNNTYKAFLNIGGEIQLQNENPNNTQNSLSFNYSLTKPLGSGDVFNGEVRLYDTTNNPAAEQGRPTCFFSIEAFYGTGSNPTPVPNPSNPNPIPNSCKVSVGYVAGRGYNIPPTYQYYETEPGHVEIKVEGIEENPDIILGIKIVDRANDKKLHSTCMRLNDLLRGVTLENPYGNTKWYKGNYDIQVTERCGTWLANGEAQGNGICGTQDKPIVLSIDTGKPLLEGDNCIVGGTRKCDDSAPHCVPNAYGEKHGICNSKPNVSNFCDTKKGFCSTIFGNLYFSPAGFARSTLTFLLSISGGILVIYLIISGYKLMTSQGDPDKIKDAREGVTAAIAGILLIIFSIAILQLVTVEILGLPGFN